MKSTGGRGPLGKGFSIMIRTFYRPARAAVLAAAKAHRQRVKGALAGALVRYRNGAEVTGALASGRLVTVTVHMAALGADEETCRRFGSHAGKRIKAAFRARTGGDPVRVWTVRNGRAIEVCAYAADDPALSAGLGDYARTAYLVAA
ncbi:hypothetical protein [Nocardia sp. NPDC051750]|uniref:hypothetical protein n=1 Tax=Nocardia sp. NPDC051750 TaxID=3364325 RepID=UPI00379EEE55